VLSLVEQAPVALAMLDRDLRYIAVSRRWQREFSRGRTDIVGHSHLDIQPDVPERWKEWYRRALAGEVLGSDEDRWQQADGSEHWLSWAVLPWRDAQGAIGGIIISAEDITARKRSDALQVRSQKLEALGTLAGGIAHDFNNILAAITGNVNLAMIDLPPGHAVQESLREIRGAANRAVELVRRILAFSRPQEIHRHPTALQPVVEEAVQLLRSTLPAMIRIGLRAEGELPMVAIDASHVHQIVLNLVTNAAHAIGNRVGSIDIVLAAVGLSAEHAAALPGLQAGSYVRLTVSDDGCGMDKAIVERIFDPFFTTKPVGEGSGLGLSVVHGIVHSYGGAISVYSEPGRGTAMQIYFPVVSDAQSAGVAAPVSGAIPQGHGEHVLYVDDEGSLVSLTVRLLERLGYRVTGCTDPQRALELFQQDPRSFDVLVTDAAMSGMSGFDLARAIHRLRPELPIVMASGYLRAEDQEAALRIGIRELIVKPGADGDLGRALGRVLSPVGEKATVSGG
jgi:PAS domain S-box-containing protein